MKVVALRKELKKIGLDTSGLKKDLQKRLLTAIVAEEDEPKEEEVPEQNPKSKIFFAPSAETEYPEEIQDTEDNVQETLTTENKEEKVDRMSITPEDTNPCTEDSMSVDEIDSKVIPDTKPANLPMKGIQNEGDLSKSSKVQAKIALFSGNKGGINKFPSNESKTTHVSPFKSMKKTIINSASKLISAASPKKLRKVDKVPSQSELGEIGTTSSISAGESLSGRQEECKSNIVDKSKDEDKMMQISTATKKKHEMNVSSNVKEIQRQLAEAQEKLHSSVGKGAIFSNSAVKATSSSQPNGIESSHTLPVSSSVKEKQKQLAEARAKRLAEMRCKSKPLSAIKHGTNPKPFSSLKTTLKNDDKRTLMTAKIREKHAALKNQGLGVAKVLSKNDNTKTDQAGALTIQPCDKENSVNSSHLNKSILSPLRSPLSTYEISDREDSDSDDSDDSEYSKKGVKKKVPNWAQKQNLIKALHAQYDTEQSERFDPDSIFPEVETCDLAAIFNKNKSRYKKRTSTGNWLKDRVTVAEKLTYKRNMGYDSKE